MFHRNMTLHFPHTPTTRIMELSAALKGKIEDYLQGHKVVLFMKGTRQQPMCGFSARTVAALDSVLPDYLTVNVLDDAEIRQGIKDYANWPTIPQLYINGELVGGATSLICRIRQAPAAGLSAPTDAARGHHHPAAGRSARPCRIMRHQPALPDRCQWDAVQPRRRAEVVSESTASAS
jgi:Grx4 family monothiol glutaredoxin